MLHLSSADFAQGTLIISTPGNYKLCEDIVFSPNAPAPGALPAEDAFDPTFGGTYATNEYGLGFFTAISIETSGVSLYLDNFKIEQSAGHALMQRFFSIIEFASSPFISGAGPAQFVGPAGFAAASNVQVLGPGTLGRSSHHGKFLSFHLLYVSVQPLSPSLMPNLQLTQVSMGTRTRMY